MHLVGVWDLDPSNLNLENPHPNILDDVGIRILYFEIWDPDFWFEFWFSWFGIEILEFSFWDWNFEVWDSGF